MRDGEWQCDSCTVRDKTVSVCDEEENQRCRRGRSEVLGAGIQKGRGPQLRQVRATRHGPGRSLNSVRHVISQLRT